MNTVGKFVIGLALTVATYLSLGYVLPRLWAMSAGAAFGLPTPTAAQAIIASLLARAATVDGSLARFLYLDGKRHPSDYEESWWVGDTTALLAPWSFYLVALAVRWLTS